MLFPQPLTANWERITMKLICRVYITWYKKYQQVVLIYEINRLLLNRLEIA